MAENITQEPADAPETPQEPETVRLAVPGAESPAEPEQEPDEDTAPAEPEQDDEGDTFPRTYVEKLRRENAEHRARAKRADDYAAALWAARVAASGRLADPTDLPLPADVDPLDDDALTSAVEDLLSRKPHLASRVPRGDAGQGAKAEPAAFSLGGLLRSAV